MKHELEKSRTAEAHRNKQQWDQREDNIKDQEYLRKLPAWKREMVLAS